MSAKAKKIIAITAFALLTALVLFDSCLIYFMWGDYQLRASQPTIDPNILELQTRVQCLENGEVWDDIVAEFEKMNSEIPTETAEAQ